MNLEEMVQLIINSMPWPEPELTKDNTAILLVDMQESSSADAVAKMGEAVGVSEEEASEAVAGLRVRIDNAIANAAKVLAACRAKDMLVAHCRVQCYTKDGRDCSLLYKMFGMKELPGSPETEWIDESIAPIEYEVVMPKTCSSFFNGTSIDTVLKNAGIKYTIIVGFYTEQCIQATARDSADRSFYTIVVSDAVETVTEERQRTGLEMIDKLYVNCMTTEEIVDLIDKA
jgi:nicotinamidase-related amidase